MSLRCLRSLFCVFEMSFGDVCARRKLASNTNHCKSHIDPKDVGKGKQLTTLNSTHNLFDQALRAPKQMYDKQYGKAKGTTSGQASVRTIQHNMTAKT